MADNNIRRSKRVHTQNSHAVSDFLNDLNIDNSELEYLHYDWDVVEENGESELDKILNKKKKPNKNCKKTRDVQLVEVNINSNINHTENTSADSINQDPLNMDVGTNDAQGSDEYNVLDECSNASTSLGPNVSTGIDLNRRNGRAKLKGKENQILNNTFNINLFSEIMPIHAHNPTKSNVSFIYFHLFCLYYSFQLFIF